MSARGVGAFQGALAGGLGRLRKLIGHLATRSAQASSITRAVRPRGAGA